MKNAQDNDYAEWQTVQEAVADVRETAKQRTSKDDDWFDPTDPKWWSECPQIGALDPTACAEAWAKDDA